MPAAAREIAPSSPVPFRRPRYLTRAPEVPEPDSPPPSGIREAGVPSEIERTSAAAHAPGCELSPGGRSVLMVLTHWGPGQYYREALAEAAGISVAQVGREGLELVRRGVLERREVDRGPSGQAPSWYRLTGRLEGLRGARAPEGGCGSHGAGGAAQGERASGSGIRISDPGRDPDLTPHREIAREGVAVEVVPESPAVEPRPRHAERPATGDHPHAPIPPRSPPTRDDADRILETLRGLVALVWLASRSYALRLLELAQGTPATPSAPAVEGLGLEAVILGLHEVALAAGDATAAGEPWARDKLIRKVRSYCAGARPRPGAPLEVDQRSGHLEPPRREETPMQDADPAPDMRRASEVVRAIDEAPAASPRRAAEGPLPIKIRAEVPEQDRRPIAEIAAASPGNDLLALVVQLAAEDHPFGSALAERIVGRGLRMSEPEKKVLRQIQKERDARAAKAATGQPLGDFAAENGGREAMPVTTVGGKLIGAQPLAGWGSSS